MVEFAMTATLLLMMVFFILEFGQATWRYNTIASIAKDAARYASVHGADGITVATDDSVQNYVDSRSQGMTLGVTTTWPDGSNNSGQRVRVMVEGTFTRQIAVIPHSPLNLHSTAEVVIARQLAIYSR